MGVAIFAGAGGILAGFGALLTGLANSRTAKQALEQGLLTNAHLENGYKAALDRIDARTEHLMAWTLRHEAQHLNSN